DPAAGARSAANLANPARRALPAAALAGSAAGASSAAVLAEPAHRRPATAVVRRSAAVVSRRVQLLRPAQRRAGPAAAVARPGAAWSSAAEPALARPAADAPGHHATTALVRRPATVVSRPVQ